MTEEVETVLQEEVRTEEENVETNVPSAEVTNVTLDEQEYQVLLKIVEAEAGGEDTTGKMLVANVVMNRVRSDNFPNSISEVVYQKSGGKAQFSPTVDGRINSVSISADTVEAVARVMNGEDFSQGALFFRAAYCKNSWFDRALTRVIEYGNHIFYTL
jgi:N-acetylmuramoyl-L-alanine amidase